MIDAETELYGIIGNPVRHSLSPAIHNRAFRKMGRNAVYLAFEVTDLREAIQGIKGLGLRGVSVTIPFKTQVLPFLDGVEGTAERIGAVNTIANRNGRLIGYNTDCRAAMEALEERIDLKGASVALLGAGGAARAIGFGLREKGCRTVILNRSPGKARELADELGCLQGPLPSGGPVEADVIINATSVGMSPRDGESPLAAGDIGNGITVMDIVYRPLGTRLLKEAASRGCRTINGLEMLCRQGAAQLEIWTGRKPDLQEIREDLLQVLQERRPSNDD